MNTESNGSEALAARLAALPDWRHSDGALHAVFKAPSARGALDLIADIGEIAEDMNHHPDLDWRFNRVILRLMSHDAGGVVTERDLQAAARISAAAARRGVAAKSGPGNSSGH